MSSRPLSWSMRFALALSAAFVIGTLAAGGLSHVVLSREMSQRLSSDVRAAAESLARVARSGDRADVAQQTLAQARASPDGASLAAFVDASTGETVGSLPVAAPFEGERRLVVGRDLPDGVSTGADPAESYLAYGIRTELGWVIAARDEAWVAESGEILAQTIAWSLAAALLLSIGLALVIARRNERRIAAMGQTLDAVGAGGLDRRIRDRGGDDLADIAGRVDRMLDRLEAGVASIRQVSTDVAHDLRAPLARLRMRLEPQALSEEIPEGARREIGSALIDIDAISATFDAILRLARLEAGAVERRFEPVDLAALAADVGDMLGPSAEEAGHALRVAPGAGPAIARGDAELLTQALVNLVDNALRHCPAPAAVTISAGEESGRPVLRVADDGPGVAAADRKRVLERFVRLDASRSTPGTGLGLSLVAAIAALHDARLELEDNGPGLRATLLFPPAAGSR